MKAISFCILSLILTPNFSFADADNHPKNGESTDPKHAESMKAWMEFSTPGAPHKTLQGMTGKWKYTSKFWHKPDSKPEETSGTSTMKMVMGGRFLEHKTTGKVMGQPFEGLGFTGYNNMTKNYETVWLDNMSTGMMRGKGSFDTETQTLKDSGEFSCPMTKEKEQKYRSEMKIIDKNNMSFSMWSPDENGKEYKGMEMMMKRAK